MSTDPIPSSSIAAVKKSRSVKWMGVLIETVHMVFIIHMRILILIFVFKLTVSNGK